MLLVTISACNKQTVIPALKEYGSLSLYNAASSFNNMSARVLLTSSTGHADTLRAPYNNLASGEGNPNISYPVGAITNAKYYAMSPDLYRAGFIDTTTGDLLNAGLIKLSKGSHQTIYFTDSLGYFTTLVTEDDTERTQDSATIRLLNLSPDAGPVRLYLDTTLMKGMEHVIYSQCTGYLRVPTTTKSGIRVTTEATDDAPEKILSRKSFPLQSGRVYTLILRGYVNPPDGERTKIVSLSALINF